MKQLVFFLLLSSYVFSQSNCELCVEQGGFYCGDDESNWTQYSLMVLMIYFILMITGAIVWTVQTKLTQYLRQ